MSIAYWIRKLLVQFSSPLVMCAAVLAAGTFLAVRGRRPRLARVLLVGGTVLLLLSGYGIPGRWVMGALENRYPPLLGQEAVQVASMPVAVVAVLGCGHVSDPRLPVTSQVDNRSLHRLAEGIRVMHYAPQAKLVLTGGRGFDPVPNSRIVARLARLFGVPSDRIVVRTSPSSTVEEAQVIKPLVGSDPFILVTTASHMPRAMAVFEKQGMHPIPAPTDHELKQAPRNTPDRFFPDSTNLALTHTAVYELLGLAWYRLRGYI
jgi:uncharacterized SAM-binding protein YcdF (DUF218 family)